MADGMTTDHEEIRRWVEAHGGRLATVQRTCNGAPGVVRIASPDGAGEEPLEAISWADWFQKFEENRLTFLPQDEKASGSDSMFFKLVRRDES